MQVHELVARCAAAASASHPPHGNGSSANSDRSDAFARVREVLESLRDDLGGVKSALEFIPGTGGNANQVFYRSPNLTLLKVCFPVGRRTPPHDHGTWATILVLEGAEKNTLYTAENGSLRRTGERLLGAGDILPMRRDTAHVAESHGERPALGLHAYGGDILALPRRMWHPTTLQEHALNARDYDAFARVAVEAGAAPLG